MSKFKGILNAAREREPEPEPEKETVTQPPASEKAKPKLGRPTGKRSNPNYEQVTAYIQKDTYKEVKIQLLADGQNQDFSELVQGLLEQWLKSRS